MTKTEMLKRISKSAELSNENMQQTANFINQLEDYEIQVLAMSMLNVGASIADVLSNISIILADALLKEEG